MSLLGGRRNNAREALTEIARAVGVTAALLAGYAVEHASRCGYSADLSMAINDRAMYQQKAARHRGDSGSDGS
mgnify:CR=1 FL=1